MKKMKNLLWGLCLIALGVIWGLNALEITDIDVFFDGWWTLLIIIPSVVQFFTVKDKMGSLIGIAIGVVLLLGCQDIIAFEMIWKLVLPALLVIVGIRVIFSSSNKHKGNAKGYNAICSGQEINLAGKPCENTEMVAIFGGITCDLSQAFIEKDITIHAVSVFGGIDLIVPTHVNVKISSTCIFGGVDDKRPIKTTNGAVTVYVESVNIFGGMDIK